jgi:polar amino acid transport system permease protein/polar amino acid transport system substrate-binding protein
MIRSRFCKKCGTKVTGEETACPKCNSELPPLIVFDPAKAANRVFIFGLLSILLSFIPFAGIVFSALAIRKSNNNEIVRSYKKARTGRILAFIGMPVSIIGTIHVILLLTVGNIALWSQNTLAKLAKWVSGIPADFENNFVTDSRYTYILKGLGITFQVTIGAALLGIFLGVIAALIRSSHDTLKDELNSGFGKWLLKVLNGICGIYLTVIRGTPIVVQLLIAYFVIFISSNNKILVAILAFGINSGAYVAEIIRSGIVSVDKGQFEAGRSLGFGYVRTMAFIIIPQAFKTVLPALANEFIVLIKETSVSGDIGLQELTKGGDIIRSRTYSAFMPLIAVAVIYLIIVMFFSKLVSMLERRLKNSER